MTALGAGLALLVGIVLGLLGGGGSVLTVPILIYALHVPVKQAIATSLCVVGLVAFIGFISHVRQRTVVGLLDRAHHAVRRQRHVEVTDAQVAQRVDHRVLDRRRRTHGG